MSNALSLMSKIREIGNSFILATLKENGFPELSPSHGDILAVLYKSDKVTMSDIAKKIHRTKATVTVLIDKLEKLKLIKRDKSAQDTRITYITLTPKGEDLKPLFEKISDELNMMLYKDLTLREIKQLEELLNKIIKSQ